MCAQRFIYFSQAKCDFRVMNECRKKEIAPFHYALEVSSSFFAQNLLLPSGFYAAIIGLRKGQMLSRKEGSRGGGEKKAFISFLPFPFPTLGGGGRSLSRPPRSPLPRKGGLRKSALLLSFFCFSVYRGGFPPLVRSEKR